MTDLFHMHHDIHPNTHIHHHSTNGDSVEIKQDSNGGHTEIVHHSDGTTETYRYNAEDNLMAIQDSSGHWYGFGLNVPHHNNVQQQTGVIW